MTDPRKLGYRHLWDPLEDFFTSKGYTLFVSRPDYEGCLTPRDLDEVRAHDAYSHVLPGDLKGQRYQYAHRSNKLVPATRRLDGSHVMIQLSCKGDQGHHELELTHYFNQPKLRSLPENHVIPLIDVLQHLDMVFIVTLLSKKGFDAPWFYDFKEALDAMEQSFEGTAFLHSHLVAHGDFGPDELLLNYGGAHCCVEAKKARDEYGPFRSYFPARYYIVDFETAVRFDEASDPASRVIQGFPAFSSHRLTDQVQYGKPMPPEWARDSSHCPFAGDVYQLAKLWQETLVIKGPRMQGLQDILNAMSSDNPSNRPKMLEALTLLREYRTSLSQETLSKWVAIFQEEFPFEGDDGLLDACDVRTEQ